LLVCGDRNWADRKLLEGVLDTLAMEHLWDFIVVHGAASGADSMAAEWALSRDLPIESHPADWNRYGNSAGPIRNTEMLRSGLDLVVAFHDDIRHSKGTKHMVTIARDSGVPVKLVFHDPSPTIPEEVR
jgi:hypothetical protein